MARRAATMRRSWVVVGAIFAVAGALLAYVPLSSTTSSSASLAPGEEIVFTVSSILGTYGTKVDLFHPYLEVTVGWSAGAPVQLDVYPCGSDSNCTHALSRAPVASGNASSGSVSFPAQSGVWYSVLLNRSGSSAVVTVNDTGPLAGGLPGMVLFFVGVGVLVAGSVLKPRSRVPKEEEAPPDDQPEPA
ncbi:MAG: hypothetical protein L3K07_00745 [Thermoplasmata archaeon]|nr:hypothetical protein [Thermoplasmata archaeon]